jgi:hypothetical protein
MGEENLPGNVKGGWDEDRGLEAQLEESGARGVGHHAPRRSVTAPGSREEQRTIR